MLLYIYVYHSQGEGRSFECLRELEDKERLMKLMGRKEILESDDAWIFIWDSEFWSANTIDTHMP